MGNIGVLSKTVRLFVRLVFSDTKVGTFPTQDLYDEAKKDGWVVISMKNDWKRIFAFEAINEGGTDE